MSKLVPLLYHSGDKVSVMHLDMVAEVMYTVRAGENYRCPHCNRPNRLKATAGSEYAYFLDVPHPSHVCCYPFSFFELKIHHGVNNHTYASYIHYLKKKSNKS